jgi:serine phosphatase RsbU (regulator of sigma subunit)
MNRQEEEFGLERLGAMVAKLAQDGPAREIADGILGAMEDHAGSSRGPADDCTVVVLKAARE